MNHLTLQTYELRILQMLLANRIHDLDLFIADTDNYTKHGEMADAVHSADVRYRADLQRLYTTLDNVNPV
jgi:hypothetical protein